MRLRRKRWCVLRAVSVCLVVVLACSAVARADWQKMDPPPDVDKSAHGHEGTGTCWIATASNILAGAGYGNGKTVQERADDIYDEIVAEFGTGSGWTDTGITWWLGSTNNEWVGRNPYTIVTIYGNKSPRYPWINTNGVRFMANELRRCQFVGLSISWPTSGSSIGIGGHAITCWGDDGTEAIFGLGTAPTQVRVTDSDRDNGGDVQVYTYDSYTNPNPGGANEGNGWYFNYGSNHPYIKHIVTLCPTDSPGDHILTQKVVGSYRIHQNRQKTAATDLHYTVGTDVDILTYRTEIDWPTSRDPEIKEGDPRQWLDVDWFFEDNPVPYCTWVTITTEFVLHNRNYLWYDNVHFTYPEGGLLMPSFRWELLTPEVDRPSHIQDVSGGYVIGAFDIVEQVVGAVPVVVGQYIFQHEYDYNQDPESHNFGLAPIKEGPYVISNLRFGHSYGYLDPNTLWEFKNWMTLDPEVHPFNSEINLSLDWQGRLPYPEAEDYPGGIEPPDCTVYLPQDLNKDCVVDFRDFAMFSDAWLENTYSK